MIPKNDTGQHGAGLTKNPSVGETGGGLQDNCNPKDLINQAFSALFDDGQRILFQEAVNSAPVFYTFPFSDIPKHLEFFTLNPYKADAKKRGTDFVLYRQGVTIEQDCMSLELQKQWAQWGFGLASVEVFSGGKSIHHHFRFDNPLDDTATEILLDALKKVFPFADWSVFTDISRLCRVPGAYRKETKEVQKILSIEQERWSIDLALNNLQGYIFKTGRDEEDTIEEITDIPKIANTFMKFIAKYSPEQIMTGFKDKNGHKYPSLSEAIMDLKKCGYSLEQESFEMKALKENFSDEILEQAMTATEEKETLFQVDMPDTSEEQVLKDLLSISKKGPAEKKNATGWKRQVIDASFNPVAFYEAQGITDIKKDSSGWVRGHTPGSHNNSRGGFVFREENGYFYDHYRQEKGWPLDFLTIKNAGDRTQAWKDLASFVGVDPVDRCKWCESEIEWRDKTPFNPDGSRHSCKHSSGRESRGRFCTDLGNGQRMSDKFGDSLRHTIHWGWLIWDGRRWERDENNQIARLAKETALGIFDEAKEKGKEVNEILEKIQQMSSGGVDPTDISFLAEQKRMNDLQAEVKGINAWAIKSQAKQRLEAMISLAESEEEISSHQKEFDRDLERINLLNGTLDLKTGNLSPHDRNDKITRIAGVAYDPNVVCPLWDAFLIKIFSGDMEIINFLRRAVGYSLTGLTVEHALFFSSGGGKNGKSTFHGVLGDLLGDYYEKTPADTLYIKKHEGISNDIAMLAGARAVIASELAEKRLNESLVKDITGGDVISARFLYHEHFKFTPQFKLWMYGNHKPIISGTDDGIWRRIKLIPFNVSIPEQEQDKLLPIKLKAELSGILNWAIIGCQEWYEHGLDIPEKVKKATNAYRSEMDVFGSFLDDHFILEKKALVAKGTLYDLYKSWCEKNNETVESQKRVSSRMQERGFESENGGGNVHFWKGLRLNTQ